MIRAIVSGAAGRMGGRIIAAILETQDIKIAGAIERSDHPKIGMDAGEVANIGKIDVPIKGNLLDLISEADVIIEFTNPEATLKHLEIAAQHNIAMVIGTTGLSKEELDKLHSLTAKTRCVFAPNMSQGVNLSLKLLEIAAKSLGDDYDIEIIETHHRFKKDAPSGTALKMAEVISNALGRNLDEVGVYGRKGMVGERTRKEIAIQAIRSGDVVGEHTVIFGGLGERIEITHRAHSRDTFVRGAIRAVRFVVKARPGLYDMLDVLNIV